MYDCVGWIWQPLSLCRNRMGLSHTQAFYLLVNNKSLASMSTTMSQIYELERDEDGFLYMVYASHEFFGWVSQLELDNPSCLTLLCHVFVEHWQYRHMHLSCCFTITWHVSFYSCEHISQKDIDTFWFNFAFMYICVYWYFCIMMCFTSVPKLIHVYNNLIW